MIITLAATLYSGRATRLDEHSISQIKIIKNRGNKGRRHQIPAHTSSCISFNSKVVKILSNHNPLNIPPLNRFILFSCQHVYCNIIMVNCTLTHDLEIRSIKEAHHRRKTVRLMLKIFPKNLIYFILKYRYCLHFNEIGRVG